MSQVVESSSEPKVPLSRRENVACNEPTYERNTMFKNREIRVRLAKADETPDLTDAVQTIAISRDDIIAVRDWMTKAGLAIGGLWLIGKAVDATCEIAVHHGTKD